MLLETALEIDFLCFVPDANIEETEKGVFKFSNKIKYKRRKFEFFALIDFLKISHLSFGSQERRNLARYDFYNRWGFLEGSNEYANASENEATFDQFQIDLCALNEKRLRGELSSSEEIKFISPGLVNWKDHKYETTSLALPVFNPTNLRSALYLSWFFGAKLLAGMKTCKRFEEDGPKSGCMVFFHPTRKDQDYCGKPCKKAWYEKRRPKRSKK